MKSKFSLYLFLFFLLMSCVSPVDNFSPVSSKSFLTIEATLTNQPGQQKVQLNRSAESLVDPSIVPVTKAIVYYTDEKGVKENLIESTLYEGTYLPSANYVGKIGSTYILHIETRNGEKYESLPEKMKPVAQIDNIISQFEVNNSYEKGDSRRGGFNVFLDFQDPPTADDYYQWTWKHYERANICEVCQYGPYDFTKKICTVPRNPVTQYLSYRCDGNCWNISFSDDLNIFSDAYLNGKRVIGKKIAKVPYSGITPYYIQIEQRGITQNAYNYFQSLNVQTKDNGTMFDIPAETRFSFNIKSITSPSDKVLGIFDVHSVVKKIFFIDRSQQVALNGELPVADLIIGEIYACPPGPPPSPFGLPACKDRVACQENQFRTAYQPEGWKE